MRWYSCLIRKERATVFKVRITEMFGIEYPIIKGAMQGGQKWQSGV